MTERARSRGRIVMLGPGITEIGGAARQARTLIDALVSEGWDVTVLARAGTFAWFRLQRRPGLVIFEIPGFGIPLLGAILYLLLAVPAAIAFGFRSDAIIAVQLYSQVFVAGIASIVTGRPWLGWTTTSGPLSEATYAIRSRTFPLRARLLNRAFRIVTQTSFSAQQFKELLPAEQISVIPNPIPKMDAPGLTGRPHALYAGRLPLVKNLERLLTAWRVVAAEDPEARLTLVGANDDERDREAVLRNLIAEDPASERSVSIVDWVWDLAPLFAEHDVYIFPSLSEAMAFSLIDACTWRRVVVASDIPPNRATLGEEYPLLFPAEDTHSLADRILKAFRDGEVREQALTVIDDRIHLLSPAAFADRWTALVTQAISYRG